MDNCRFNFARTILRPVFPIAILQETFTSDMGSCSFAFIILNREASSISERKDSSQRRAVLVRNLLEHSKYITSKLLGRIQALLRPAKIFGFGTHEPSHLYGEKDN